MILIQPKPKAPVNGQRLELPQPRTWPEPVNGADLIRDIYKVVRRYVVLSKEEALAMALWVLHTYALDATDTTPRLAVTSPTKRCGKTTLFKIVRYLVNRPLAVSNISPAAVFRTIEVSMPTLLADEGDTYLRGNSELVGVLNSGHTRETAYVSRCVGKDFTPRRFCTWAPVAIALIGKLPETLEDRSIEIRLRRKLLSEHVERLNRDDRRRLETFARKAARWVKDNLAALKKAKTEIPNALDDRAADNWRPLLAIADCVGEPWPTRARQAAIFLSRRREEAAGEEVELLGDIKRIFEKRKVESLGSKELVELLTADPLLSWAEYRDGQSFTERRLATLLKPFGIYPASDGRRRGYRRHDCEDAFSRYLPSRSSERAVA